jgi:hypothetical protein
MVTWTGGMIVTTAVALLVLSASEVAFTATCAGFGIAAGAV